MFEITIESIERCLDMKDVLAKAKENYKWSDEQASEALKNYMKHWFLAAKHPNQPLAAISKAADDLWHQHILDTRKYTIDCQRVFGCYMHHQPIYGRPSEFEKAAYNSTVDLYMSEFAVIPEDKGMTSGNYSYRPIV